ncbi:hypothetical protein YTPLAS73_06110 [Nitrosarchaeum sp.]|nr:hypothetical protein YTPLAS73_06110 [Nitrosarchaeum sp.]
MKTRLLIIIAVFLVTIPWVKGLEFSMNSQVMADGITISASIFMTIVIAFSLVSWFLLSWASKNISLTGLLLSVIAGASLAIPFLQVMGPIAVVVGIVAGFAAYMFQKKMTDPAKNYSLMIAIVTIVAAYFVLAVMILAAQTSMEEGIGEWTGTVGGMEKERKGFENIFNNNIEFSFFLVLIPSWIITGWIILDKKKMKPKVLIIIGVAMMAVGFLATLYSSFVLFPSTEPPMMRPIEGMDYVFFMYRQEFLLGGMIGIFVTVAGIIPFLKEITEKRDMRKRK